MLNRDLNALEVQEAGLSRSGEPVSDILASQSKTMNKILENLHTIASRSSTEEAKGEYRKARENLIQHYSKEQTELEAEVKREKSEGRLRKIVDYAYAARSRQNILKLTDRKSAIELHKNALSKEIELENRKNEI